MKSLIKFISIIIFGIVIMICPRIEIDFGKCLNDFGDGKLYNGEPYYNYIHYPETIAENDIVITAFVLDNNGECSERLFDKTIWRYNYENR